MTRQRRLWSSPRLCAVCRWLWSVACGCSAARQSPPPLTRRLLLRVPPAVLRCAVHCAVLTRVGRQILAEHELAIVLADGLLRHGDEGRTTSCGRVGFGSKCDGWAEKQATAAVSERGARHRQTDWEGEARHGHATPLRCCSSHCVGRAFESISSQCIAVHPPAPVHSVAVCSGSGHRSALCC